MTDEIQENIRNIFLGKKKEKPKKKEEKESEVKEDGTNSV